MLKGGLWMSRLDLPAREYLAELAARRARLGLAPGPALGALRALTTAELLAQGPAAGRAADAAGTLREVCAAAQAAVRRPPGWLYAAVPDTPLPVGAPGPLLAAAVLAALRGTLQTPGRRAVVRCLPRQGWALLCIQGGAHNADADAGALWRAVADKGGGNAVWGAGPVFTAAARLPLRPDLPMGTAALAGDLLVDRYALPYLYLGEWCAGPWT